MKRYVVMLCCVAVLMCTIAYLGHRYGRRVYHPEVLEAEVYEKVKLDVELLIGCWTSGMVYYIFELDGSGVTWNAEDDVTKEEASAFTWSLKGKWITLAHHMNMSTIDIPKKYRVIQLDLMNLCFEDEFGKEYVFSKVEIQ